MSNCSVATNTDITGLDCHDVITIYTSLQSSDESEKDVSNSEENQMGSKEKWKTTAMRYTKMNQ